MRALTPTCVACLLAALLAGTAAPAAARKGWHNHALDQALQTTEETAPAADVLVHGAIHTVVWDLALGAQQAAAHACAAGHSAGHPPPRPLARHLPPRAHHRCSAGAARCSAPPNPPSHLSRTETPPPCCAAVPYDRVSARCGDLLQFRWSDFNSDGVAQTVARVNATSSADVLGEPGRAWSGGRGIRG